MKATVILFKGKPKMKKGEKTGEYPLMVRLVDGKNRKHISLKVSLSDDRWDFNNNTYKDIPITAGMTKDQKQKVKEKNTSMRNLIASVEHKYNAKIKELTVDQRNISLDSLYKMVEKPVKHDYTLFQYYDFLITEFKATGHIGQKQVYAHSLNTLKKFLDEKDVTFEEVDISFLHRYERYLKRRNLKNASLSVHFRTLRSVINKAIKEGYAKEYPFKDFKVPKGEPNRRALSVKDMQTILKHKKIDKNNDYYRMMVFSYFTCGMNYVDLCRLTWDNIRSNEIHYTRQKIHHNMIIPIHKKVHEVIKYYKKITGNMPAITGLNDNYVFPILNKEIHKTEQQIADRIQKTRKYFNDYLKTIGKVAEVEGVLSSYVLRHTAITNLVRAGVTADAVQSLAGHKKLSTTEGYIREASQEQKSKAVNML